MSWSTILQRVPVKLLSYAAIIFIVTWVIFVGIILTSYFKGDAIQFGNFGTVQVVKEGASALPTGAVVAFDLPAGCPSGWKDVAELNAEKFSGRTFIVAGPGIVRNGEESTSKRDPDDHGGAEKVKLNENQLAGHRHALGQVRPGSLTYGLGGGGQNVGVMENVEIVNTQSPGALTSRPGNENQEDLPHENMPPFIALHFCKNSNS